MEEFLSWQTTERQSRSRTPDWYWVLGIFAVTLAIASIIFGNFLFAVVILTGALAIGFASVGSNTEYSVALTPRGVLIDTTLYPYENIISFCIFEYENEVPMLSLRTKSIFSPQLNIPITNADPYEVYDVLLSYIEEEIHEETLFDRVVDFLGF